MVRFHPRSLQSFSTLHPIYISFILKESLNGFVFVEENQQNSNRKGAWWAPAMQLMGDVSTWIVVPIVLALVFGKMLDTHFGTKPIIFLTLAGFAFLVTCFGIFRIMKNYMKKLKESEKAETKNN